MYKLYKIYIIFWKKFFFNLSVIKMQNIWKNVYGFLRWQYLKFKF